MNFRFGIRSLLLTSALVAAFFPFRGLYDHWFRSTYSGYHVHRTLRDYVSNGDSFDYVSSLFDRSEARTRQFVLENGPFLANRKSIFADHENGDEYHVFFINGGNVRALFQFRDGVVVNHLKRLYQFPYSTVQHHKDRAPSSLLRNGALLVYTITVASCGMIAWVILLVAFPKPRNA